MFQSVQSFLAYLLALLVVYACLRVFRPAFLRDAGRELRRQFGAFGCVFLFCAVSLLAGRVVSKNILRSPPSPQMIPEWFTALGYDPADTDGDGIPDCWERWTRTNRAEADDELDPDGDGVDNFGEFWNQCDPMMADTDGDGYSDYVEIAGKAVGKTWYDPIVPASYGYAEIDADTNGVPDRWEGTGYVYGFTDSNHDGFPDGLAFPTAGDGNFDIEVTVTTSRSALLSWGAGTGKGLVLPPCDGQVVRVRLEKAEETNIRLVCGLPNDGTDGLWKARYSVGWASGRDQQTEGNRIQLGDGTVIDIDGGGAVSFRGEVVSVPTRGGGSYPPDPIPLRLKWIHIDCLDGVCWEHDSGGYSAVAIFTNVAPPFAWYVDGNPVQGVTGDTLDGWDIIGNWLGWEWAEIRCVATNGPQHEAILVEDWNYVSVGHCPPSTTNIVGAAWTSTHTPTNATDHLPYAANSVSFQWGPNCPETIERTYCIGWDHEKVNTRNLPVISTGDWRDAVTDHCLALEWSEGKSIDLASYLNNEALEIIDRLHFTVNGSAATRNYSVQDAPEERAPIVLHVQVFAEDGDALDSLWIVVYKPSDKTWFDDWYADQSTNLTWTTSLAKPCHSLVFSGGKAVAGTGATGKWSSPDNEIGKSYMHHNAVYEMRTNMADTHGNQATFDGTGAIITSGIRAGTADFYAPYNSLGWFRPDSLHRDNDVRPYIMALQLDGNPVVPTKQWIPKKLNRPALYQGATTDKYLVCRPTIY